MERQLDMFHRQPGATLVSGLRDEKEFVSAAMEATLLAEVDNRPWLSNFKRRVQHYGYKYDYKARAIS